MRDNGNQREAFGLGGGSGVVRVVEWTRTEHQVSPHEGFASGLVWTRGEDAPRASAPATLLLAVPPDWAQVDGKPCTERVPRHNEPDPYDTSDPEKAAALCAGCPVRPECLEAALEEEGDLAARSRWLVRGGLTPKDRAESPKPITRTGFVE